MNQRTYNILSSKMPSEREPFVPYVYHRRPKWRLSDHWPYILVGLTLSGIVMVGS